jgi:flagellar protein FliS
LILSFFIKDSCLLVDIFSVNTKFYMGAKGVIGMNAMVRNRFLQQYAQTNVQTGIEGATPHRLIQMLYEGALDVIAQAKGAMIRKDYETKGKRINHAITIITGLRGGLDLEKGGEIAENLNALYEFMVTRLLKSSARNDVSILDEVSELLREVKTGWDQMPDNYRQMSKEELIKQKKS